MATLAKDRRWPMKQWIFRGILAGLFLGWAWTAALAAPVVYFEDDFNTLDLSVWQPPYSNNFPVTPNASGGFLNIGAPGVPSLDLPVVYSVDNPFPLTGGFTLEIGFQYSQIAGKGSGFVTLDGTNASARLAFWADTAQGFRIIFGDQTYFTGGTDTGYHVVRYEVVGNDVTAYLDGTLLGTSPLPAGRP